MPSATAETSAQQRPRWFGVAAAGGLLLLFVVSLFTSKWVGQEVIGFVTRVANQGWYGEAVFLGVIVVICLIGVVPASMLAIAAGTIYGFEKGLLLSSAGLSVVAVVGFLASRTLFRNAVARWLDGRVALRRIDTDIADHGWRVVMLLRLSPVAPFGITSYALGMTRLTFADYMLGTMGSLPAMMAYVYMGLLARTAVDATSGTVIPWLKLAVTGVGVVATIVATMHFFRILSPARAES
jgi:uncharacterized membrane protein YdjX (TVP38/TMEM64 family)